MNVLYYTSYEVAPSKGGTERTTSTVANYLRAHGHKVYSVYEHGIDRDIERTKFDGTLCVSDRNVDKYARAISEWDIDVVINQGDFYVNPLLRRAIDQRRPECKLLFAHHFEPGWETVNAKFSVILSRISLSKLGLKYLARFITYPVYAPRAIMNLKRHYKKTLEESDLVVLLSESFAEGYRKFASTGAGNIAFIPNALSFEEYATDDEIQKKRNIVLAVSRLQESQKKLSLLLKSWELVEKDPELSDWELKIVGDGPDRKKYEKMASKLQRVRLFGRQQPAPYYREAALFGMTSVSEGWGLTLTEAQQMGCVPVAMDSYTALHDIITDGDNGQIVPYPDVDAFARTMKELMLDKEKRTHLARRSVESAKRFTAEAIGAKWENLLATELAAQA